MAQPTFDTLFKNVGQTKGLESVIYLIANFTLKADNATRLTFYGGLFSQKDGVVIYNPKNPIDKALQKGLIKVLQDISSVDFCNLITYLISQSGGGGFNPKEKPEGGNALKLWNIQFEAYKLQLFIDKNLGEIGDILTPDATLRLTDLLSFTADTLNNKINAVIEEFKKELESEEGLTLDEYTKLNKQFQKLFVMQTVLSASAQVLETLGSNVTIGNFQKAINTINKVRSALVLILGIKNPAALLSFANQLSGGAIQNQFAELNKSIPVDKLIPLLKKCLKQANNINSTGQKILGQIRTIQFFVKIAIVLIKVFSIIKKFFTVGFQLPNLFTTVSVTTTVSNVVEEQLGEGTKKLILRLEQINYTLGLIYNFCNVLLVGVNEILILLNTIKLNIESCQNVDDDLKNDLLNTINSLTNTRNQIQTFVNAVNSPVNKPNNTFGEYTIEIITEQVVDEGINLKRRFGIARGKNNIIAVQSTPTFASLDLIIINEVKTLLVAQGLVSADPLTLTGETLSTISESLSYLEDQSINIDTLETPDISIEGEESTGLQTFVNNLPGGKALRKKVRNRLIKSNEKLIKDLRRADPSSTGTENLIKQKEQETNKLKIEKLEDQKSSLQKLLLLSGPVGAVPIIAKIKAIDNEIKALKNSIK